MAQTSLAQRAPMQPVSSRIRAYFAPVLRASAAPSIFDLAKHIGFALNNPPAPWIDAGWINGFKRASTTKLTPLHAGPKGAPLSQYRAMVDSRVSFDFAAWGKLQMALSSGSQHMNILAEIASTSDLASGGTPPLAVATLPGSTAAEIVVGGGAVSAFSAGDMIAVDSDYHQQTGYVGAGVPGAYVNRPSDVLFDVNYVRRVTFNVGRIVATTLTTVQLAQPLIGGVPPSDAAVQKVIGFVDREGGSFFQEWSALFVMQSATGARVFFHYPRLQAAAPAQESDTKLADIFDAWTLHASFIALPTQDINDGEQVLCFRSYLPAASAALY